jgi:hypothetical protein
VPDMKTAKFDATVAMAQPAPFAFGRRVGDDMLCWCSYRRAAERSAPQRQHLAGEPERLTRRANVRGASWTCSSRF